MVEALYLILGGIETLVDAGVGFKMVEAFESQSGIPSEVEGLGNIGSKILYLPPS